MDPKVFALISAVCFGVNPIVLKLGMPGSSAEVGVFVGLLSGLPILLLLSPALGGFQFEQLVGLATLYFVLGGLFVPFMGRTFLYLSIDRLGSARAVSFKNSAPLFTAVLALLFLHESVALERWMAIGLVTAGLTLVGRMARRQTKAFTLAGFAIALLAALSYGIRPFFVKLGLSLSPVPLAGTLIGYLTAIGLYLGYFVLTAQLTSMRANRRSVAIFAVSGVLQAVGMLLLFYALDGDDVSVVYPVSASAPLVTFVLSYTLLKNVERLTIWDLVGALSIVTGVIFLLR
ncbi:MAG: EamA family transporter [Acidobacteriota bacterium]